ncbi:hypothetical protein Bsp3421_000164 (plasmid) [Burkholderia sp. FERM BP-3421]|uniref:hypothetical protein n=1 Tax=Burkholderia sp. FERM BP-3421 TaxID=1494466 RepID=UPI0023604201|nr:hypothetical protein [Burkholderia sp. FERM BP-3421]WDD90339.1 hypothetical protein Bsp3421_000164 [Burkholderia sp. FERM BP-3421]
MATQQISLWMQIGSAVFGLIAVALWFWAAKPKAPPANLDGGVTMQKFLGEAGSRNMWAAGTTAISVLFSAASTLLSIMSTH